MNSKLKISSITLATQRGSRMISSLIRSARLVAAIVALAYASTYSEPAPAGSRGTSGTCGFLVTMSRDFAYLFGEAPPNQEALNVLGTIDFQTKTIWVNAIVVDMTQPDNTTESDLTFSAPFTTAAGPIPGSSTITFSPPGDPTVLKINLLPVSAGKTILMQMFSPTPESIDGASVTGRCEF